MSIQANINQGLSLVTLLFQQTDVAKKWSQETQAKKDLANYYKMAEQGVEIEEATEEWAENVAANTGGTAPSPEMKKERAEGEAAAQETIAQLGENAAKKLYELNPTEKTYQAYVRTATGIPSIRQQKAQYMSKLDKQIEAKNKAADALAAEQARLKEANSLDLSKLDERARPRVERAYKKAERDTKYLTKKEDTK